MPIGLAASLSSAPAEKETQRRNHPQPLAGAACRPPQRGETGRKPVQGLPKADCAVHKSTGAALALAFWDGVRGRRVLLHKRLPPHSRDRLSLARSLVSSVRRLNRGGRGLLYHNSGSKAYPALAYPPLSIIGSVKVQIG
jgi:hypothetical protein